MITLVRRAIGGTADKSVPTLYRGNRDYYCTPFCSLELIIARGWLPTSPLLKFGPLFSRCRLSVLHSMAYISGMAYNSSLATYKQTDLLAHRTYI